MNAIVKNGLIIVLLFVVGLLLFKQCDDNSKFREAQKVLIEDLDVYAAELVDEKNRVYQLEQKQIRDSKYAQALLDTIEGLKNITSSTRIITKTEIKEVKVPYEVEVPVYVEQDGDYYLRVPLPFRKESQWHTFAGVVMKEGILFSDVSYTNDFTIVAGTEDHGSTLKNLFKRNRTVIQVRDNNPYASVTSGNSVTINNPKNRFSIGPMFGYGFTQYGDTYFIGAGINYSLISF